MNKRLTTTLFLLLALSCQALAYDFSKTIHNNQKLYFTILQHRPDEVVVVAPNGTGIGYGKLPQPSGRLVIPDQVQYDGNTYRVVGIASFAFARCDKLTALTLPESLTEVGVGALDSCASLRSLTILCDSLAQALSISRHCPALDTLVIGPTARVLPPFIFSELQSISYISLLSREPAMMKNLFFGCTSKAVLHIGSEVSRIPQFFCYNFSGLRQIVYDSDAPSLSVIEQCAFVGCTGLDDITLPPSLVRIEANAFAHCQPRSITFLSQKPPLAPVVALLGIDPGTPVYIPCHTLGQYANSSIGRVFSNLAYAENCPGSGSSTA